MAGGFGDTDQLGGIEDGCVAVAVCIAWGLDEFAPLNSWRNNPNVLATAANSQNQVQGQWFTGVHAETWDVGPDGYQDFIAKPLADDFDEGVPTQWMSTEADWAVGDYPIHGAIGGPLGVVEVALVEGAAYPVIFIRRRR